MHVCRRHTNGVASEAQPIATSLAAPECVTLEVQKEGGNSTQRCPGILGYQLLVLDSDSRMSVTILDPQGRKWPLSYDQVISRSFTSLGPVAQWRVIERSPRGDLMALTIEVNANEDPESGKVTSYWAVAKVAPSGSCVTDRIESGPNEAARLEAAVAALKQRPCLGAQ